MAKTDNQKQMKHFRKWAKDKHPFFTAIYYGIAGSSESLYEMINLVRKGKRIEGDILLPKIKTWFQYYKSPKGISKSLFGLMSEYDPNSAKQAEIFQSISQKVQSIQDHPKKYKSENGESTKEAKAADEDITKMSKELGEIIIQDMNDPVNDKQANTIKNWTKNPEAIFFFRVQAPCFMLYGTHPHLLLKKAQSGDDAALEKLIRLDKSIIFEPKISEIIHQAQGLKAQARKTMIEKAFISQPKAKLSRKKVKCLLGGLISHISILFNQKLSAAEIRKLFDAISLDMTGDIDQDLGDMAGEVFEKAIQRSRNFWNLFFADKK